jgi:amino acid permease
MDLQGLIIFSVINVAAVHWYGEAEFWLAFGKLILFGICSTFTLVTSELTVHEWQNDQYGGC